MKRRPNVRYRKPEQQKQDKPSVTAQAGDAVQDLSSDELRETANQAAQKFFEDWGGKSLERRLQQDEKLLDVLEQDIERSLKHPDPDKFRWRVKPSEKIRIGREMDVLTKQIQELREKAWNEAVEMIQYFMSIGEITRAQDESEPQMEIPRPTAFKVPSAPRAKEQPEGATRGAA